MGDVGVEVCIVDARRRSAGRFGRHGGFVTYMRSAPAKGGRVDSTRNVVNQALFAVRKCLGKSQGSEVWCEKRCDGRVEFEETTSRLAWIW